MNIEINNTSINEAINTEMVRTVRGMDLFDNEEFTEAVYAEATSMIKSYVANNTELIKQKVTEQLNQALPGILDELLHIEID